MLDFGQSDITGSLRLANELAGVMWQCWAYGTDNRTFALCAWPDRYLVFRQVTSVRLPFALHGAEFSATRQGDLYQVLIRSQGKEFNIICADVAYYETDPHTLIQSQWNEPSKK